jgi:hypothetical protein
MARRAAIGVLAAALLPVMSAAATQPNLRSVSSHRRHVVAVFTLGELAPGEILVASRPATGRTGALKPANLRLRESMAPSVRNGVARWETKRALRPGTYYIQVSGRPVDLDCLPLKGCPEYWSNVRRLAIRKPRL